MSLKKGLKDLLDQAHVTALPVRIGRKPKGVDYPCAIIRAVASQYINTNQGTNATQQRLVQIDCWGNNPKDADDLAKAVHAVLNGYRGTLSEGSFIQSCLPAGDVDLDDEELKCSGIAVDFSVWFIPAEFLSP